MEKIRFQKYDRLVALIHLIVLLFILVYIQLPGVQYNKIIYLSLLFGAFFTLIYHYLLPKKYVGAKKYLLESIIEIFAITFFMVNSGGHTSLFFFLYFLVITGSALTLGSRVTFVATLVITLSFLSLFYLEYKTGQMTPHLTEHLMHAAILTIALWVFAFLTASLSQINRKLYDKEAGARRELATIAQTSATILSSLNVDQILKKIVGGLTGGAGYDRALIFLINKDKKTIEGRYASGISQEDGEKIKISLLDGRGLLFNTIWKAKPHLIKNFFSNPGFKEEFKTADLRFSSEIAAVPIVSRIDQVECQTITKCDNTECPLYVGVSPELSTSEPLSDKKKIEEILDCPSYKVFGTILVDNYKSKKPITEDNIVSLQIFAQNAAIAIENAILYTKREREAEQIRRINKIGKVVTSSLKIEEIYSALVAEVKSIIHFDRVSISLLDEKEANVESYALSSSGQIIEKKRIKPKEVCCAEWVTKHKKPLLRQDLGGTVRFKDDELIASQGINTCYSLPLLVKDRAIGTFCLYSKKKAAYSQEDLKVLMPIAEQLAIAIENAILYEKTKHLAITDSLTDLYNHGYARKFLAREFTRASRYNNSLSVVMMDIDDFKNYNDSYGHPKGDKILVRVAEILKENVRDIDIAARYGGDEFILVLPETGLDGAQIVAERVEKQVREEKILTRDKKTVHVTITAGIASYPSSAKTAKDLIQKADDFLYGTRKIKNSSLTQ